MTAPNPIPTDTAPPEASIAESNRIAALDAKLADFTARKREREAGKPSLTTGLRERADAFIASLPAPSGLRDAPDEPIAAPHTAVGDVMRRAMITARFATATLENFEPATPSQHAALAAVHVWLSRALGGRGGMLALIAPTGRGKSHLLYAAANALATANRRFYARPWYRLADEIRYGGVHPITGRNIEAPEVRATLLSYPILLLDEVRPTANTAFDDTELVKLACHAYDQNLSVIITTNTLPLSDVMGPAAASRFAQLVLDGPDRRQA